MKPFKHLQVVLTGLALLAPVLLVPAAMAQTSGKFILTVNAKKSGATVPVIQATDLAVTVNRKHADITNLSPIGSSPVELLIAVDDGLRGSFNNQFDDMKAFINTLPPNVKVALGYMQYGVVTLANSGFTADHAAVIKAVRTPTGISGVNGSPYIVLSDVCKNWPSNNKGTRRELLVISDGVDRYNGLRYDPQDPYLLTAIRDAQRNGVLVDSIYYADTGIGGIGLNSGQNYLQQLADGTGGYFFTQGMGMPVSISNYLSDLNHRLQNQYEVEFSVPAGKKMKDATLKVTLENKSLRADAPDTVVQTE